MFLNICNWLLGIISGILSAVYIFIKGESFTFLCFLKSFACGILVFLLVWVCIFLLIWIFFILIALTINWKKDYKKISPFYNYIFILWYKYVTSFAHIKLHFKGLELIPHDKKFLTVCNHRSNFDNFFQAIALDKVHENIAFITKPDNYKIPLARNYMKRGLYLPIDRENVRNALKTIMQSIAFINDKVINIGVFPEGTRSKSGQLLPFKPGCLKIAEKTECPIVVFTLQGSEKISKNFFWKRTDVYLEVEKVIQPQEFVDNSTVDVSDEIRKLMLDKLGK